MYYPDGDFDNWGEDMNEKGQELFVIFLYLLLNFAVSLKLL